MVKVVALDEVNQVGGKDSGYKKKSKPMVGRKFGSWTVLGLSGNNDGTYFTACDCGVQAVMPGSRLTAGRSSCCITCFRKKERKKLAYCLELKGISKPHVVK